MKKLKRYEIPCSWEMYGRYFVRAKSLKEAIAIVEDEGLSLPFDGMYVEGSFLVDGQIIEAMYPKEAKKCR